MAGFVLIATPMIAKLTWAALVLASAAACGGIAAGEPSSKREPGSSSSSGSTGSSGAPSSGSSGDSQSDPQLPDPGHPGSRPAHLCCPPDPLLSGTMHLGGTSPDGSCITTSDFWCSTNWRLENDKLGCSHWVYDVRKPAPGETAQCQPAMTCTPGNYVFCRCADATEATKLCKDDGTFAPCSPCP